MVIDSFEDFKSPWSPCIGFSLRKWNTKPQLPRICVTFDSKQKIEEKVLEETPNQLL